SLGGLMGSGFIPIDRSVRAALLNATGGGLSTQLFLNSSIGAGASTLVNGILGLDPANLEDQFALSPNLTQTIMDPADGVNSAALLLQPVPHNVIQVEDFGDEVVPNQANEVLAVAAGLDWFGDVAANGAPGTFRLDVVPNFNPVENLEAPAGASTLRFFARTVDAGGALALSEPTPDVTVDFETNLVASRVTAARTMLGSAPNAA